MDFKPLEPDDPWGEAAFDTRMRAALFSLTSLAFFAYWLVAKPAFDARPEADEWPYMLAFSAIILALALALPHFADLAGGQIALQGAYVGAAGALLSSAAYVFEESFEIEAASLAFLLGTLISVAGLAAMSISLAGRVGRRRFALVPAGTMAGLVLFGPAGGPVMLVTWLVAAVLALRGGDKMRFKYAR